MDLCGENWFEIFLQFPEDRVKYRNIFIIYNLSIKIFNLFNVNKIQMNIWLIKVFEYII